MHSIGSIVKKLQNKEGFSDTESLIADYLLEHFRDLGNMTTRQLARHTFTNSAAIVRFSQKLGFEGYTEFKVRFLAEMMQYISEPKERYFTEKDNTPVVLEKLMHLGINAIKESYDLLNPPLIVRATQLIAKTPHIDFYAMGTNIYPLHMITDSFAMVGKSTSLHESLSTLYLQAYNAPKDHLAFFVSRTGENHTLLKLAQILKQKKRPILVITADTKSSLAKLADITIPGATADNMNEGGPRIFLFSTMYILNALWACLMTREDIMPQAQRELWLKKNLSY